MWPDEPGCIKTCERFPNVPKMKKLSKDPILANRSIEYECKNKNKIPETGERFYIQCLEDGLFEGKKESKPYFTWPFLETKTNILHFCRRKRKL